jgi:hypothetical protein
MKQRKCSLQLSSVKVHSATIDTSLVTVVASGIFLWCAILFDNQDMSNFWLNLQVVLSGWTKVTRSA